MQTLPHPHRWLAALVACTLALAAPACAAPSDPVVVTESDALRLALAANRALRVAREQVREAWWAWRAAAILPAATVSVNYQGGKSTNGWANLTRDTYATLQQSFPAFGTIAWSARASHEAWAASRAAERQARVTLIQGVRDAFYALLIAQSQLQGARDNLQAAEAIYGIADTKFRNGAAPHLDLLNAEIQKAAAEQAVTQATAALQQARGALAPLLGLDDPSRLVARGDVAVAPLPLTLQQLAASARAHHPQIESASRTVAQVQAQVRAARAQANPSTQVFYMYDLSAMNTGPVYMVGAQLQLPLDYGQIACTVRQQQAGVAEKQAALEGTVLTVEANVQSAWAAWTGALETLTTYRARVLEPSEKVLEMTTFGYREGAVPYAQVLIAQQNLRTARTQYFTLLLNGHQALDALEAAVGMPLEEVPR